MKKEEYILLLPFGVSWLCFQSSTSLMLEKRNTIYISLLHNSELSAVTEIYTGARAWHLELETSLFFHNTTYNLPAAASSLQRSVSSFWLIGWMVFLPGLWAFINFLSAPSYHSWRVLVGCCQIHVRERFLFTEKMIWSHFPFLTNDGAFSCQYVTGRAGLCILCLILTSTADCIHFIH